MHTVQLLKGSGRVPAGDLHGLGPKRFFWGITHSALPSRIGLIGVRSDEHVAQGENTSQRVIDC